VGSKYLLYATDDGPEGKGIYLKDIYTMEREKLVFSAGSYPSISPDGEWVVFETDGILWIGSLDGKALQKFEKAWGWYPMWLSINKE
jgi:Tol biopolymer transport system component